MEEIIHIGTEHGLRLAISPRGATWLSCSLELLDGTRRSVILEREPRGPLATERAYLGATVGRYANRIAQARISRGGRSWALTPNAGSVHQLHGGPDGFSARTWRVERATETSALFSLDSPDGDQGFPGGLTAWVTYRIVEGLTIEMEASATVTKPSPVCLTNHAYFNLDGPLTEAPASALRLAATDARHHRLRIEADRFVPVDEALIPLGALASVRDTGFDFRRGHSLGLDWLCDAQQALAKGYDHAFLLNDQCRDLRAPAAVLSSADGAVTMELRTTLPALQLYAGQLLEPPYRPCSGLALEPQFLPDSPNHPEWPQPSCWLEPGQVYSHRIHCHFVRSAPAHDNS